MSTPSSTSRSRSSARASGVSRTVPPASVIAAQRGQLAEQQLDRVAVGGQPLLARDGGLGGRHVHGGVGPEHLGQLRARHAFRAGREEQDGERQRQPEEVEGRLPVAVVVRLVSLVLVVLVVVLVVLAGRACARAAPSASATSSVSLRTALNVTSQAKRTSSSVSSTQASATSPGSTRSSSASS